MYFAALEIVRLAALAAVAVLAWRGLPWLATRPRALAAGIAWIAAVSAEYWILGPFSFLGTNAEADLAPGIQTYLARWHDGGQFAHALGGGNDVAAMAAFTGQVISLERMLLGALPLWLASAVFKIAHAALAYAGAYLLLRRAFGAGRDLAFAAAAVFALSSEYMFRITWAHGLGFALIPLAVYLCVTRAGRRHYVPGVVAIALLNAVSSTPTHSDLALFAALGLFAALAGGRRMWMGFGAMAVVAVALAANWADSLFAKALLAPYAIRADVDQRAADPLVSAVLALFDLRKEELVLAWAGLALLFWRRGPLFGRAAAVFLVAALAAPAVQALPWDTWGLGALGRINFARASYALNILGPALLAVAVAPASGRPLPAPLARVVVAAVFAVAAGQFAWVKAYNVSNGLSQGGLGGMENAVARLAERDWRGPGPSRVVSVPYRLPANLAAAAGLETLDGGWHLNLRSLALYWKEGVVRVPTDVESGYLSLEGKGFDPLCCPGVDFDTLADTDLLRLANVGYVLSVVPLKGRDLSEVSPPRGAPPPLRAAPLGDRIARYARAIFDPPPVHIYRLKNSLPRVYAAREVVVANADVPERIPLDLARARGPNRGVVIRNEDRDKLAFAGEVVVEAFALERDAVRVRIDAPVRGAVVLNVPFTPFWRAFADGRPVALVPANRVQMAAAVPPGAREIVFHYARPRVIDRLLRRAP
jgi:hypothetical protein